MVRGINETPKHVITYRDSEGSYRTMPCSGDAEVDKNGILTIKDNLGVIAAFNADVWLVIHEEEEK